jgi:16S rRNA processing protein RimM
MDESKTPWTVLAHLLRPQGRKGELLAELHTDFPESFTARNVYLAPPHFTGLKEEARQVEINSFWLPTGRNHGRVVLQLAGIESISAAEQLAGLDVIVPENERLALDDESTYVSELVGSEVFDGATRLGTLTDVQFPATADGTRRVEEAVPLLTVTGESGDEILIPFAKVFLVTIDAEAKRIVMTLPEGLVEINRSSTKE